MYIEKRPEPWARQLLEVRKEEPVRKFRGPELMAAEVSSIPKHVHGIV